MLEHQYQNYLREMKSRVDKAQEAIDRIIGTELEAAISQIDQQEKKLIGTNHQNKIHDALLNVSENLAWSYAQVKTDIQDDSRISWAGTAHEIREVIATLLRLLAPDEQVTVQSWYEKIPNTSRPTQKQRVRYILQLHQAGSKEREVVEQVGVLENMIGDMVRSTYSRASDAAHRYKAKKDVIRILRYFEAFAYDLLNLS